MYKKKSEKNFNTVGTILGDGMLFQGNVSGEGSVKIDGLLNGDINVGHTVVVGLSGSITGEINAAEVIVFGEVNGRINAGTLEIKSTGKIKGEVLVETLISESGCIMKAKCEMKDPEKPESSDLLPNESDSQQPS